jgi:predicted nuclease of predicted toxin-antitoxin system
VSPPPTFFIDRCLGKRVARALRDAGISVEIHDDHFPQKHKDVDWIPEVTDRGWVIMTKDKNIRRKREELEALRAAGARVFALTSGNITAEDMVELLLEHREAMEKCVSSQPAPFVATVNAIEGVDVIRS